MTPLLAQQAARVVFAGDPRVTVLTGESFPAISQHGPYDLLFSDGGGSSPAAVWSARRSCCPTCATRLLVGTRTPEADTRTPAR